MNIRFKSPLNNYIPMYLYLFRLKDDCTELCVYDRNAAIACYGTAKSTAT